MDYIWPTSKCKRIKKPKKPRKVNLYKCNICGTDITIDMIKRAQILGYPRVIWHGEQRIILHNENCYNEYINKNKE